MGNRVELSPGYDLWARGARFGTVHSLVTPEVAMVRMDNRRVRKLQMIPVCDLKVLR
jgi:hypothetical protein